MTLLCNATGIYRKTVNNNKIKFKTELAKLIFRLRKRVDSGSIKNSNIRKAIKKLSSTTHQSIGASQKPINVYLKFYVIISGKRKILRELDCPIDSYVIKMNHLKKISLKNLDFKNYKEMQDLIYKKYNGLRIMADILSWDNKKQY